MTLFASNRNTGAPSLLVLLVTNKEAFLHDQPTFPRPTEATFEDLRRHPSVLVAVPLFVHFPLQLGSNSQCNQPVNILSSFFISSK